MLKGDFQMNGHVRNEKFAGCSVIRAARENSFPTLIWDTLKAWHIYCSIGSHRLESTVSNAMKGGGKK